MPLSSTRLASIRLDWQGGSSGVSLGSPIGPKGQTSGLEQPWAWQEATLSPPGLWDGGQQVMCRGGGCLGFPLAGSSLHPDLKGRGTRAFPLLAVPWLPDSSPLPEKRPAKL